MKCPFCKEFCGNDHCAYKENTYQEASTIDCILNALIDEGGEGGRANG